LLKGLIMHKMAELEFSGAQAIIRRRINTSIRKI
jgi:hypothetical protein